LNTRLPVGFTIPHTLRGSAVLPPRFCCYTTYALHPRLMVRCRAARFWVYRYDAGSYTYTFTCVWFGVAVRLRTLIFVLVRFGLQLRMPHAFKKAHHAAHLPGSFTARGLRYLPCWFHSYAYVFEHLRSFCAHHYLRTALHAVTAGSLPAGYPRFYHTGYTHCYTTPLHGCARTGTYLPQLPVILYLVLLHGCRPATTACTGRLPFTMRWFYQAATFLPDSAPTGYILLRYHTTVATHYLPTTYTTTVLVGLSSTLPVLPTFTVPPWLVRFHHTLHAPRFTYTAPAFGSAQFAVHLPHR